MMITPVSDVHVMVLFSLFQDETLPYIDLNLKSTWNIAINRMTQKLVPDMLLKGENIM